MARLTGSLSDEARHHVDEKAAEHGISRSAYIGCLIAADILPQVDLVVLEEGYRAMAAENQELAD